MNQLYRRLNLTAKLSIFIVVVMLTIFAAIGFYFDGFLKENYLKNTKKRMQQGYDRIATDLRRKEKELKEGISFVQEDEALLASLDLINNYQDKQKYDAILLDEEKKLLVEKLLDRVKLSLNSDIAFYDKNKELIAFVTKEERGYELNFISYRLGKMLLYNKLEEEKEYTVRGLHHPSLMDFRHVSFYKNIYKNSVITYHYDDQNIYIKSHKNIYIGGSKQIMGHIEMSYKIGDEYFSALSRQLDMTVYMSLDKLYATQALPLLETREDTPLEIIQTKEDYHAVISLLTKDTEVYLIETLQKSLLNTTLEENRQKLLVILLFAIAVMLFILRTLFKRSLALPLKLLMDQIHKIEHADYSQTKQLRSGDELETISKNINTLAFTVQAREASLKKTQEELEYLSNHDPLTDLPNRRFFNTRLEHAINIAEREKKKIAVVLLDLDGFKEINDALGHDVGDELLKLVAERLKSALRKMDTVARMGGDEFYVLIERVNEIQEIENILTKMQKRMKDAFECKGHEIKAGASMGVCIYPDDGKDGVALLKNADLAMYQAKKTGQHSYRFFSNELSEQLTKRMKWVKALSTAVEDCEEFFLLYQPKISLHTGKISAIEALIRWDSSELGFVRPDQFIALAEETSLIVPLGEWILKQACSDFVKLKDEGYLFEHVSINVSGVQLSKSDMIHTLHKTLEETAIDPKHVEVEITETYIATHEEKAMQTLQAFREMGVNLAIDDFGTGYSSLSYLQKLPVTRLKIDKSFVDDIPQSSENIALIKAIVSLARAFGLSITAEGVEKEEQLEFLKSIECDEIQGYLYAKPLSLEELKSFYTASKKEAI